MVLGGITNQPLGVGEGDVRGGGSVTLIISDDLNAVVLPYSDARVGGAEIDSDSWTFSFTRHCVSEEAFEAAMREIGFELYGVGRASVIGLGLLYKHEEGLVFPLCISFFWTVRLIRRFTRDYAFSFFFFFKQLFFQILKKLRKIEKS